MQGVELLDKAASWLEFCKTGTKDKKPTDKVAAAGFFVVVPDFFYGDPVNLDDPQFDRESWFKAHCKDCSGNGYSVLITSI
ncbi:hypothetical protein RchiOBHm_Chr4g0417881 [Rosa chinensis]|uniref:Uncharacterized protein n=1 Tax=Rosa chinensis TaxID=74649 RepID=A0A2P6QX81_ROSCH|nr:hypothetical protein RchiOBHm_Chr4g0417881 [Rosa chinensis]